jgi:hypothetical protein
MVDQYTIEDAHIIPGWRNFSGQEDMFNQAGSRVFSIMLRPEDADAMANAGWNVKIREPKEELALQGVEAFPFIQVQVGYKAYPPKITMISSAGRTTITEAEVDALDALDFKTVDLILRPREWENALGKKGIKAYLKTMFVTIEEDELERKYALKAKAKGENIG